MSQTTSRAAFINMAFKYLSPEALANLHQYEYKGTDNSYLYQYILSPTSAALVTLLPNNIAQVIFSPNLLSLIGHICCVGMLVVMTAECGMTLSCRPSDNAILLSTVLYFTWLILDNMDGKQARRTNTSTPLGMIVDHQVDALSVTTSAIFFAVISLYGDSANGVGLWVMGTIPFFFATWEELQTGSMDFPLLSGPAEGCVGLGLGGLFIWLITPEVLVGQYYFGVNIRAIMSGICWIFSIGTGLYKQGICSFLHVLLIVSNPWKAVYETIGYVNILLTVWITIYLSQQGLVYIATKEFMLFIGYIFAKEILQMQIAHITNSKYRMLSGTNLLFITVFLTNISLKAWGVIAFDEYYLLVVLMVLAGISYWYMAIKVTYEITGELGITVFGVGFGKKKNQ